MNNGQAAKDQKNSIKKWAAFTNKLESYLGWEKLCKKMVSNLDDKKQWAPLHYAVFHHNSIVCDNLTAKTSGEKHFQCGMQDVSALFKSFLFGFKILTSLLGMEKMFCILLLDQIKFGQYE